MIRCGNRRLTVSGKDFDQVLVYEDPQLQIFTFPVRKRGIDLPNREKVPCWITGNP